MTIQIRLKLNRNFTVQLNRMREKYGEDFEKINGFAEENFDLSSFVDNFIDSQNTADSTIDANANIQSKDICNLITEIPKPYLKLLGFNKLFYEIQKKYGFARAKEFLEAEWRGNLYVHNPSDISFRHYCLHPKEICVFIYNGRMICASLEQIYFLIEEEQKYDKKLDMFYKNPINLKVQDYNLETEKITYTKVTRICYHPIQNDMFFTKLRNGKSIISTEDHIHITTQGQKDTIDLITEDYLYSIFDENIFTNSIEEYNGLILNEDLGWLCGIILAEAYFTRGQISICQSRNKSPEEFNRITRILNQIGIPYKIYKDNTIIRLTNGDNNWERRLFTICKGSTASEKILTEDFIHFNDEFLKGFLSGIIDGDGTINQNRMCSIRMSSRGLINQLHLIGQHFGVFFSHRVPYIHEQKKGFAQRLPLSGIEVNMNNKKDFFLSLSSRKVQEFYTHYVYDRRFVTTYEPSDGEKKILYNKQTYETDVVYDLSTESHTFVCNGILVHNCWNYDLRDLATKGMYFIDNIVTTPAKHLSTFCDHTLELISYVSNRQSGGTGLANVLMWFWWFWHNDVANNHYLKSPEYYRDQCFQKFIFDLSMPYLRITQCAYTTLTIFDRTYCEEMFGGYEFPDGKIFFDYIEEFIDFQKAFMNKLEEMREVNIHTFPVVTYSLVYRDGKFTDEEFARWASTRNMTYADANFMISENTGVLSSCCLEANEKVLTKNSITGVKYTPIKEVITGTTKEYRTNFTVFHNGSWVKAKCVEAPSKPLYKIITANKKSIIITEDHLTPTLRGDIFTTDLTTDDYILFNTASLESVPERDLKLTYAQGFLIGAYAGDGSQGKGANRERENNQITLSLNEGNKKDLPLLNQALIDLDINKEWSITFNKNVMTTKVSSGKLYDFIFEWISGGYSYDKSFNLNCLLQSKEFRKGIIDGWYATDGGNSNRIYSTSKDLIDTGEVILTSLGRQSIIDKSDRVGEVAFIDGDKEYRHNYPLWCLRFYGDTNRRTMKNVYIRHNNSIYFKINSIEKCTSDEINTYCFSMEKEYEPYFTLPNGMITHNCRLLNNSSQRMGFLNSIGGGDVGIGSMVVTTLNLAGLAYQSTDEENFFSLLDDNTRLVIDINDTVRSIIKRNIEKGLLPNFSYDLIKMDALFNTIGVNGIAEAAKHFGYYKQDEFGYWDYTEEGLAFASAILDSINEIKDSYSFDYNINIEQVPFENGAVRIAAKNQLLYNSEDTITANQWIALKDKATIQARVRAANELDSKCSGGCITHIQIDAPFNSEEQAWEMLNYIAANKVIYFAFNLKVNVDSHKHTFTSNTCPICGDLPTDTYQRIVGYLVPTSSWSKERRKELMERDWMNLNDIIL